MAEAIIGPLVGKLQDLALSEAKALVAVNGDILSLRDKLMWMQACLRHDDEQRRNTYNELIRVWVRQIRDAACDAEDAIDLFVLNVDLSSIRHNLSVKISGINARLDEIMKTKENYMTKAADNKDSAMVSWRPSVIMSTNTKMDDLEAPLIERACISELGKRVLNTDSLELLVIYVTGKPGVGKATVVREVYEMMKTQTIFEKRVWVSFPPFLSVSNILQLIHQQLEQQQLDIKNNGYSGNDVEKKVQEKLLQKRFLLVIDGDFSNSDWMALQNALRSNAEGSRVVRIMQDLHDERPPWTYDESNWIPVKRFSQYETTNFFKKWVTNKGQHGTNKVRNGKHVKTGEVNNIREPMHVRLHNITGGRPLAVVLLCGLLRAKEYPYEWDKVLDHMKSKQSNRLENILTMCFDDLPHDIKSCFLYFAALPMNTDIEANKLVCLWMAEGFLRPKDGKTMERLGKIYLKELVARNLVKVVKRESFNGGPFVAVHHKVHSFLLLEAQEANFVEIHNGDDSPPSTNTRRLSLQNYTDKYAALADPLPKLRSILSTFQEEKGQETDDKEKWRGDGDEAEIVTSEVVQNEKDKTAETSEVVQIEKDETVATSEVVQNEKNKNAKAKEAVARHRILGSGMFRCLGQNEMTNRYKHIQLMLTKSTFLRIINLQGIEFGEKLPAAISAATQLQYLGVTACSLRSLPPQIGELKHLQTLDVRDTKVDKLPQSFWEIKTLRHVFGSYLILPRRVGNLKYLQTLETIQPDDNDRWDEKTFTEMVNLRYLYLSDSSGAKENLHAVCRVISNPVLLEYLEKLVLQNFIDVVGDLTLLSDLILEEGSYEGEQLDFVNGKKFRSLQRLTLSCLKDLKKLKIDNKVLLQLTHLVVTSYDTEDFNIDVDAGREFVQRIKAEDKYLYGRIIQGSFAKEQSDQLVVSFRDNEDFNVDVDTVVMVKRIESEDTDLYCRISQESDAKEQSDQVPASSSI
ncbi:hypothetical protein HU200_048855 [Digitaria exilis]|uniref:Uncharacterized protein n=1 Tax=Digitaria exilis TaxID=1010633 RepID=A0A835EAF7_9POAL|nr:hypothetical protein HU200_048855 [Digitaria exilis]